MLAAGSDWGGVPPTSSDSQPTASSCWRCAAPALVRAGPWCSRDLTTS